MGRTISLIIELLMAAGMTSAQSAPAPGRSGGQLLVAPRPGMPISFEQVEEYSSKPGDGSSAGNYINKGKTYRDSTGRVRVEVETRDGSGHASSHTLLIDPASGYETVLLSAEKVGYRVPTPVSKEGKLVFTDPADGQESPHKWKTKTEDAGKRTIEGIEFNGKRIISTAEDDPRLTTTIEQWYAEKFRLTGAINRSGPYSSYTVKVHNIHHEEPDPKLFAIPSDYNIIDIDMQPSPPGPQE